MDPFFEKRLEFGAESSPSSKQGKVYGDRFIPVRNELWWKAQQSSSPKSKKSASEMSPSTKGRRVYTSLLQTELLGGVNDENDSSLANLSCNNNNNNNNNSNQSLFQYCGQTSRSNRGTQSTDPCFLLSPLAKKSQQLLSSSRKQVRRIPTEPFKDLRVPGLEDDFYVNPIDWSSLDVIAVSLTNKIYLWNFHSSEILSGFDVRGEELTNATSVAFDEWGTSLAIGTCQGEIAILDVETNKVISWFLVHEDRIGSLDWNKNLLASGSKDRSISVSDARTKSTSHTLRGHRQEVCGLKWSPSGSNLATGSNDNRLMVWDVASHQRPLKCYTEHTAAIKALDWSPHHHGLLASGGGSADRTIRMWDTLESGSSSIGCTESGSQVCALAWSTVADELITTHGFSLNEIVLWEYPNMDRLASLTGHSTRVLYLATSPDGSSIATGAGDESLKFWNIHPKSNVVKMPTSQLNIYRIR